MAKGSDYKIKKIEKGPLQRFKNQNLLIKKFGETGLQVYKSITGKRTSRELRKDLGMDDSLFDQILTYMQDAGMVELEPTSGKAQEEEPRKPLREDSAEELPEAEVPGRSLEDIPPEEEIGPEEEKPPLEEEPREKEGDVGEEAQAEEELPREAPEPPEPLAKKKTVKKATAWSDEDEIRPIMEGEGDEVASEEEKSEDEEQKQESAEAEEGGKDGEKDGEGEGGEDTGAKDNTGTSEEGGATSEGSESPPEEDALPEKENAEDEHPAREDASAEEAPKEDLELSPFEESDKYGAENELSPVEKIISDKYGDIGLRVYALIDGQRTAEEIMRETGLTEPKLVEILDFMDEQGIIKLDYPKGGKATSQPSGFTGQQQAVAPPPGQKSETDTFSPMIEGEESLDEARGVLSPVEVPIKAPLDLIKSVQMKAKIMFKFGDKGGKILESVNGKNDVLDISLKLDMALYDVTSMLSFMMENGMIIMKPMTRADVRKKYGDDGYSVYKRYGKEGLMLYELIGREMTIGQMAGRITKDKAQIIDMFIFIHKVLGIDLPIDRDVLTKQLGL